MLEVRYENLHKDIEAERIRLYDFLEVDPHLAAQLEFNTKPGFEVERPEKFLRKGKVGDWRNYFTPRTAAILNEHAGQTMLELGYVDSLDWFETKEGRSFAAQCCPRPDLAKAFPNQPSANLAGYRGKLPKELFENESQIEFTIVAKRENQIAFKCLVVKQMVPGDDSTNKGPYSTDDGVLYV